MATAILLASFFGSHLAGVVRDPAPAHLRR
jgi:hypothetical protein